MLSFFQSTGITVQPPVKLLVTVQLSGFTVTDVIHRSVWIIDK